MTSPVIAIHGGAGTIDRRVLSAEAEQGYHAALRDVLVQSNSALRAGASAVEAVTLAVTLLEDCSLFNAGHGAVLTSAGTHELDAAIMDGRDRSAGAIAGVLRVRNPVQGARLVMEKSGCVLLIGAGAELFLEAEGLVPVDPGYFTTPASNNFSAPKRGFPAWHSIMTRCHGPRKRWSRLRPTANSARSARWRWMRRAIWPLQLRPAGWSINAQGALATRR
jgi:isoaspartyl peptidase/L-asparaginase-like protein (Ntn-hydrolase superfamily)